MGKATIPPPLRGTSLYTREALGSRVGVCEVARADMKSAPTASHRRMIT